MARPRSTPLADGQSLNPAGAKAEGRALKDAFYSTFTNGHVPGVMVFDTAFDLRMTWAAGVFKNVTNPWVYQVGGGDWAETMRVTGLLLYEDEGRKVMHLGITGRYAGNDNGTDQYRLRAPERSGLSPTWLTYANTQPFHATGGTQDINNLEADTWHLIPPLLGGRSSCRFGAGKET